MSAQVHQIQQHVQIRTGPLPDPETISAYERALPGTADRIIQMAEREQNHRHLSDSLERKGRLLSQLVGQVFAFSLGGIGICGGVWLVSQDKPLTGFTVFLSSLGTLVSIFILRQNAQKNVQKANKEASEEVPSRQAG